MGRRLLVVLLALAGLGVVATFNAAQAHECDTDPNAPGCHPTPVMNNWRGTYLPLFETPGMRCDLSDPETGDECEQRRREEQRWRDEWGCNSQFCTWAKVDNSLNPTGDQKPNSAHAGVAADHSMFELAHDSEGHGPTEGNHDTHGGSVYADICLGSDADTSYEGQPGDCTGPKDTQIGANLVDHNPCGPPVNPTDPTNIGIPIPCSDEYHTVRPLDPEYTQGQLQNDIASAQEIAADPEQWLCGYDYKDQNPANGAVPTNCP